MKKIYIGEQDKTKIINDYIANNDIEKVYIFGDNVDVNFSNKEYLKFTDLIKYKYYYRLLQEVNTRSLIVINECLKRTNRYDLTYNCIRRYLMNRPHRIVFNYLPIKEKEKDFAILNDFTLDNPFLKDKYEWITDFSHVDVGKVDIDIKVKNIIVSEEEEKEYLDEKEKVFSGEINNPNMLPVKMLKVSEGISKRYVKKFDSKKIFKPKMNIVVNQTKADKYYYEKLMETKGEVYESLQRISRNIGSRSN